MRENLVQLIEQEARRIAKESASIAFDGDEEGFVDINVCEEVDEEMDVRVTGLTGVHGPIISAEIEVMENVNTKPLIEMDVDVLLKIYERLLDM